MRSYDMFLVKLPRGFGAEPALAIGTALVSAANLVPTLPAGVNEAKAELEVTSADLHQALSEKLGKPSDTLRALNADRVIDSAWVSIHHFLNAWLPIPGHEDDARRMLDVLYPTGLAFVRLPFKVEWSESESRLTRMKDEGFDKLIAKLGGQAILAFAESAHAEYGDALGITSVPVDDPKVPIREKLDVQLEAMRFYVLQVVASVRRADPKTQELADALLRPLATWEPKRTVSGESDEPTSEPATPATDEGASGTPV